MLVGLVPETGETLVEGVVHNILTTLILGIDVVILLLFGIVSGIYDNIHFITRIVIRIVKNI